ncbi:MAG TPA: hypothetical protein DCM87_04350 [Planctomycetes bacterium]|nr:hypothetical protein [Planctomycetota bacterium]
MLTLLVASLAWGAAGIPEPVAAEARKSGESFVRLSFRFGPDTRSIPGEDRQAVQDAADRCYERAMSFKWTGITVDPQGSVLCADPCVPLWRVVGVEAEHRDGRKVALAPAAVFVDWNALLFAPSSAPEAPVPHVEFHDARLALGEPFYRIEVMLVSRDRYLQISPALVELVPLGPEPEYRAFFGLKTEDTPFGGALLLNGAGAAVGFQTEYDLWDGPGGLTTYHPAQLRAGARLDAQGWRDLCGALDARVARSARKVQIHLRNVKDEEEDDDWYYARDDEDRKVLVCYGIAIGGGRFFVPIDLARELAHQITRITVDAGGREREAPFIGMFAEWGALLIGGAEGVEPIELRADAAPRRGKLFLVHRAEERFGRLYQETDYNRWFNVRIGTGEEEMPDLVKRVNAPALLFDVEGGLIGFYLVRRTIDSPAAVKRWEQVASLQRLAPILADAEKAFDPLARPRPAREEKRPVWLGIEFQPVRRDLMELKGLLGPTREGRIGLLVSHVYARSPAEALGLARGDILLKLVQEGESRPVELAARRGGSGIPFYWGRSMRGEDDEGIEPSRLWRPARNYLTDLLTRIGPGKKVTLAYLSGGQERQADLVLEEGPDDFESAEKLKERTLGLYVRNLTYEVRDVLRLAPDDPGVVISMVEPGGKAAVRSIRPYEILTHIDSTALRNVHDVRAALDAARRDGDDQILLRLWNLGETRIVAIDLAAPEGE